MSSLRVNSNKNVTLYGTGSSSGTSISLIIVSFPHKSQVCSPPELNKLLHEYGSYIIGRMGLPYRERNVHIISVAIDAPQDVINALSGKIGRLDGITAKTVYSNVGMA